MMSEALRENPDEAEQKRLFAMGPGSYGDTVRPIHQVPEGAENIEPTPERPKKLEEMTANEMIAVALQDRLVPDIHGLYDPKRNAFIKKFNWTPESEAEATAAIGEDRYNNPGLISYLLAARQKGGLSAVAKVMTMVNVVRSHAKTAIETLDIAQVQGTKEFIPDAVRNHEDVRQDLAHYVYDRNSLNLYEWPDRYERRTKTIKRNPKREKALMGIKDKLMTASDETIVDLCNKTLAHQQARLRFWREQHEAAITHPDTETMIAAARSHV